MSKAFSLILRKKVVKLMRYRTFGVPCAEIIPIEPDAVSTAEGKCVGLFLNSFFFCATAPMTFFCHGFLFYISLSGRRQDDL